MRDQILSEIKRLAEANGGKAPGAEAFETATGITTGSWRGLYWARWSDALTEAGYRPNKFGGKFEADHVIGSLIEAARHYKRLPTEPELQVPTIKSGAAMSWSVALRKSASHCLKPLRWSTRSARTTPQASKRIGIVGSPTSARTASGLS
jgi:hypothetical protein